MAERRAHISLKTKLASALCQMVRFDEDGKPHRVISYEESRRMSADQIIAQFQWDHYPICHADGGPDEAWNLVPRTVEEHRVKTSGTKATTAGSDVQVIAKGKRLSRDTEEFRRRILAKDTGERIPKQTSRLMPGSRASGWKKTMSGEVVRRERI